MKRDTLGPEWHKLVMTVGSAAAVAEAIGMTLKSFNRAAHGLVSFGEQEALALQVLSDEFDVDNPLLTMPRPRNKELRPLSLLGEAIQNEMPISQKELDRLKDAYPVNQLIELAESDGTPPRILLAVTRLLDIA